MATATVTSKGQVTIPASIRTLLGLVTGSKLEFVEQETGWVSVRKKDVRAADLSGFLPRPDQPVTLEKMEEAMAEGVGKGFDR